MGANLTNYGRAALAGYAGMAGTLRGRLKPGAVVIAVDVFAVAIGLGVAHIAGTMMGGSVPLAAPSPPPLVSPISTDDRVAAAIASMPHLRPAVEAVAFAATPDATVMFAPAVVTDAAYRGGSDFTPPVQTVAMAPTAPALVPAAPTAGGGQSAPPVAKLAAIALRGRALARAATVSVASDGSLDAMLLSRGGVGPAANIGLGAGLDGNEGASSATVAASVQLASAALPVSGVDGLTTAVATNVGTPATAVTHAVGGVVGKVTGLLN